LTYSKQQKKKEQVLRHNSYYHTATKYHIFISRRVHECISRTGRTFCPHSFCCILQAVLRKLCYTRLSFLIAQEQAVDPDLQTLSDITMTANQQSPFTPCRVHNRINIRLHWALACSLQSCVRILGAGLHMTGMQCGSDRLMTVRTFCPTESTIRNVHFTAGHTQDDGFGSYDRGNPRLHYHFLAIDVTHHLRQNYSATKPNSITRPLKPMITFPHQLTKSSYDVAGIPFFSPYQRRFPPACSYPSSCPPSLFYLSP
jgi:hypothetical protein